MSLRREIKCAICVLGMHRSGTSCLAGMLEDAGVYLGNVSKKNPFNLKGNQENIEIMRVNDEILDYNKSSWDDPPEKTAYNNAILEKTNNIYMHLYQKETLWAFKDPRTMFTLDVWLEIIPSLNFIGTFRNPINVAESLMKRQKWPLQRAVDLWEQYNLRMLELHDKFKFDILNFDLPPSKYREKFMLAMCNMGIDVNIERLKFYDSNLISSYADVNLGSLGQRTINIYNELLKRAL